MRSEPITVLLAEHEPLAAQMLRRLLDRPDLRLAGVVTTGRAAVERTLHDPPDVLVVSTTLPDLKPLSVAKELLDADSPIPALWLTDGESDALLLQAARYGIMGFVSRSDVATRLPRAIRVLAGGGAWIDTTLGGRMIRRVASVTRQLGVDPAALVKLTDKERQALSLLGTGCDIRLTAERMKVKERTVKKYLSSARRTLDLETSTEAASVSLWFAAELQAVCEAAHKRERPQTARQVVKPKPRPRLPSRVSGGKSAPADRHNRRSMG